MSKKKTYDQKIEEYMEKLKIAQKEKKEFIEKKGRQLWTKIKTPFMEKEKSIEVLLMDKDKLNIVINEITKVLDSLSFETPVEDITNDNKVEVKNEDKNTTNDSKVEIKKDDKNITNDSKVEVKNEDKNTTNDSKVEIKKDDKNITNNNKVEVKNEDKDTTNDSKVEIKKDDKK